jgi:hypothetical protein
MNDVFTLRVSAAPADLFATLFAIAFASLLTGLTIATMSVSTPFATLPALTTYAALSVLTLAALRLTVR